MNLECLAIFKSKIPLNHGFSIPLINLAEILKSFKSML